jgi:hypothetical protein
MSKAWEARSTERRQRQLIDTVLIVCEGTETEPNYFKKFPQAEVKPFEVKGTGKNTQSLVAEAQRLRDKGSEEGKRYNQVWCVFDKDSFTAHFANAITSARSRGFNVAYSNEAFELWYLLHFAYHDAALSRTQYEEKLTKCLGRKYDKSDETLYETLLGKQAKAIKNAEKLLGSYAKSNPELNNPCTSVHELVILLNKLSKGDTSPQAA